MWGVLVVCVMIGCVDRTVVERPPCSARIYGYDVAVTFDDAQQRGCVGPWPWECAGRRLDVDPDTPGVQYDCSVSDVQRLGQADQTEHVRPECDAGASNAPCWRVIRDNTCGGDNPIALEVIRDAAPSDDSHVIAYCFACLADWYGEGGS